MFCVWHKQTKIKIFFKSLATSKLPIDPLPKWFKLFNPMTLPYFPVEWIWWSDPLNNWYWHIWEFFVNFEILSQKYFRSRLSCYHVPIAMTTLIRMEKAKNVASASIFSKNPKKILPKPTTKDPRIKNFLAPRIWMYFPQIEVNMIVVINADPRTRPVWETVTP